MSGSLQFNSWAPFKFCTSKVTKLTGVGKRYINNQWVTNLGKIKILKLSMKICDEDQEKAN